MKSKEKVKLAAIRSILTAIKQKEVDDRVEVDEAAGIAIMSKIVKQRRESVKSYTEAGRADLADAEAAELEFIASYLPKQLTTEEVVAMIAAAVAQVGATSIKDMGKVMNVVRPQVAGKADAAEVGDLVKKALAGPGK